jgi:hypothetical protein
VSSTISLGFLASLKASVISYTKRNDGKGLYVNCNNPEKITEKEFNTVLTSQDVTDKEVFFTFEHNNANTRYYYYGYRVTNTDDHDIFVTVKNLGTIEAELQSITDLTEINAITQVGSNLFDFVGFAGDKPVIYRFNNEGIQLPRD